MSERFDTDKVRQFINQRKIIWRRHALERILERGLSRSVVLEIAANGEVIEEYSEERSTPTALLFGWDKKRPIHVVLSFDSEGVAIITAYEPSLDVFESDYRTRRKR